MTALVTTILLLLCCSSCVESFTTSSSTTSKLSISSSPSSSSSSHHSVVECPSSPVASLLSAATTDFDILLDENDILLDIDEEEDEDDDQVDNDDNDDNDLESLSVIEIKSKLLDLIPKMMGTIEEYKLVESYVNILEDRYEPITTLGFLNLAMAGEWQLLFSTSLASGARGATNPQKFRIREQLQTVNSNNLKGTISNKVTWDLAEEGDGIFESSGTFDVEIKYEINQGARMVMMDSSEDEDEEEPLSNTLKLAKGSKLPKNIEKLVGLLYQTMPKELFDPTNHAIDTTYLDGDLRIVRMTGPKLEGIRDIFIRKGSSIV